MHSTAAAQALAKKRASLRNIPGVIGTMSRGGVIVITVMDDNVAVPSSVKGVPVVKKIGSIPSIESVDPKTRFRPIIGGISTGPTNSATGTIGCIIQYNGQYYCLSNNHVFALCNQLPVGSKILQPGSVDGGEYPEDMIGELVGYIPYKAEPKANIVDMALAKPSVEFEQTIAEIGSVVEVVEATEGMRVQKFGRTTGFTTGTIVSTDAEVTVNASPLWEEGLTYFEDQIIIEGDVVGTFSAGGDSGAAILDESNNIVGLLFAGTSDQTIANKITNVISKVDEALGVQIEAKSNKYLLPILGVVAMTIGAVVVSRS